jgi:hypothetical protein
VQAVLENLLDAPEAEPRVQLAGGPVADEPVLRPALARRSPSKITSLAMMKERAGRVSSAETFETPPGGRLTSG